MRTTRAGMTLVELLMALVLALAVVGAVVTTLTRQQRLYAAIDDALQVAPRQLDATAVLASELRTMYVPARATSYASDSTIDVDAIIGASILCVLPSGPSLILPPQSGDSTTTLTSWHTLPDSNDAVLVYYPGAESSLGKWVRVVLNNVATGPANGCFPHSIPPSDGAWYTGAATYTATLPLALGNGIRAGVAVRFVRTTRYSVYRASDNAWYIGARRCSARTGTCETVQPLVGPFPGNTTPPIVFRYFTASGTQITPNALLDGLARIDVVLRRPAAPLPTLLGAPQTRDSIITTITLRNHP